MNDITPMEAIRKKCLDCCCNQYSEVKECLITKCPIWRFRLGLNPNTARNKENPLLQPSFNEKEANK